MASITITPAGTFRVLVRRKGSRTVCKTFPTRAEAQRFARRAEAELDAGKPVTAPGGATVADAIDAYRKLRDTGKRSIDPAANEHYMLLHLDRGLGETPVASLTPQRIADFCRLRAEDGAGAYTVGMEVSKLGTVLRYAAISLHATWGDPVTAARPLLEHLGLIGPGKWRDRRPTPQELDAVRAKAQPLLRDIIDFAVATCMRRGEIVRIVWRDLDAEKRVVVIRDRKHPRVKRGNDETIPLLGDALAVASRQPRGNERIFPVTPEWVSDNFLLACRIAGVDDLHFHDLRHHGISLLFERGYTIEQVALVSGHRSWQQLRRYTHLRPEHVLSREAYPGSPRRP